MRLVQTSYLTVFNVTRAAMNYIHYALGHATDLIKMLTILIVMEGTVCEKRVCMIMQLTSVVDKIQYIAKTGCLSEYLMRADHVLGFP